jgi:hypothetical protein
MDVAFVGQLIDSMGTAVLKLEQVIASGNVDEANRLRTFIFDLYMQIEVAVGGKHV